MNRLISGLAALVLLLSGVEQAGAGELTTNGGFESGFTGWSVVDQAGGSGSWFVSSSFSSPMSGFATPGPRSGSFYALTDQGGPGSHALLQTFTVTPGSTVVLSFAMFSNDRDGGPFFHGGASDLDYTGSANQHARVDILTASASAFDTGGGVVTNLYNSASLTTGPTNPWVDYSFDITDAVGAGGTFQIRFAEVDNQSYFEQGVDNVSITTSAVPEPASLTLLAIGIAGMAGYGWRKRKLATG